MTKFSFLYITLAFVSLLLAQAIPEFRQLDDLFISVRTNRGDIFFPEEYFSLKEKYDQIHDRVVARGLQAADRKEMQQIYDRLKALDEASAKIRPFLNSALAARDAAIESGAMDFAPAKFHEAEQELHRIALRLKKAAPSKYEKKMNAIEKLYRQAQFEAIRNKLLSEVRIFMQEARNLDAEKYAPKTFALVNELFSQVKHILQKNQFNDPTLPTKAQRLLEESQHLLYITQTAHRIYGQDGEFEGYLLQLEKSVRELAQIIDYNPEFTAGIQPVLSDISLSVKDLRQELAQEKQRNEQLRDSLRALHQTIRQMRESRQVHDKYLALLRELKNSLPQPDVQVDDQSGALHIHMNGISYPPGSIKVPGQDRALLEAIGRALQNIPKESVLVRLTQASSGNPDYNMTLAEQRAEEVALIVQTAGFIPDDALRVEGRISDKLHPPHEAVIDVFIEPALSFK